MAISSKSDMSGGTPNESKGYGAVAVATAGKIIVATNSVELDTISGASATTKAIGTAGKAALAKIPGTDE